MDLAALVKAYLELAGGFGRPVHLSHFELPKGEIERLVSAFDEDYQISRYMLLTREGDEALEPFPVESRIYLINGFEVTHLTFHPDVQKIV